MTARQHLQWAAILRRKGKPDKARRHEQFARAIEKPERQPLPAQ